MRCFIAIELPSFIKANLYDLQKRIGNEYAKVNWVAKKNLHLTLKFLRNVDEEELNLLKEALRNVKEKKFRVGLGKLGYYPGENRINVLWISLKPEKEIMNLHGEIELKFGSLFEKDERFSVHLTLGRVKLIKKKDEFLSKLKDVEVKWDSFLVDQFVLVRSVLSKDGPKYDVLEKYSLK